MLEGKYLVASIGFGGSTQADLDISTATSSNAQSSKNLESVDREAPSMIRAVGGRNLPRIVRECCSSV